jgi:hypothetical protein
MSILAMFSGRSGTATTPTHIGNAIDMVTYAAGLVSNSKEIDDDLEKMRYVTARIDDVEHMSASDMQTLLEIYVDIERYLITKEPIRSFDKQSLRAHFTPVLQARLTNLEANRASGN